MLISCRCSCTDTVLFVQELRELAIEGTVKGSLPDQRKNTLGVAFKGGKALPLSQTVAFAEAYMKRADLPEDHLKRIKNLVRRTPYFFFSFQPSSTTTKHFHQASMAAAAEGRAAHEWM